MHRGERDRNGSPRLLLPAKAPPRSLSAYSTNHSLHRIHMPWSADLVHTIKDVLERVCHAVILTPRLVIREMIGACAEAPWGYRCGWRLGAFLCTSSSPVLASSVVPAPRVDVLQQSMLADLRPSWGRCGDQSLCRACHPEVEATGIVFSTPLFRFSSPQSRLSMTLAPEHVLSRTPPIRPMS